MEKTIDDFLNDISEAKEFEATTGFALSHADAAKIAERLVKIMEFENKISDLDGLRNIIKDVKRYKEASPVDLLDGPEEEEKLEIPSALRKTMQEVDKIISTKNANELTAAEEKKIQDFTDKLTDEFKKFNQEIASDYKETGVNTWKIKFLQSFPVKLSVGDQDYYGLVRPPTGVITWQGPSARAKAIEAGVPVKLPIMNVGNKSNPEFKVKRGADAYGEFMSKFKDQENTDFDFNDSKEAKEKVIQSLEDSGVSFKTDNFEKRSALKGVEDAILKIKLDDMIDESLNPEEKDLTINEGLTKNVRFWKNITKIF